ncbi:thyroid receptor-interacting protein 13 [Cantharellus anzutake]|uniref:thyroid receptor-interacting protein 13 n=1 Tax=Cantharellus anzutake TaxID=1750568 RepID=UPI00190618DC|nr:thyroid receptor-interacting protein 13 [Cantharellus anzutake]KAF8338971.1 thyroid receptor-interacting protein 13 [Cantharellus anzutake]
MNDNEDARFASPMDSQPSSLQSKWLVHIEVRLKPESTARFDTIATFVRHHLEQDEQIYLPSCVGGWDSHPVLGQNVEFMKATESTCPHRVLRVEDAVLDVHVYQPSEADAFEELSSGGRGDGDDNVAATVCDLPNHSFEGLWDSLMYPDDIKPRLLNYIYATFLFSDANVNSNLVAWNRIVLLHGPPGTGKTSLCRALAQKLSIRLSLRYSHAKLVEVNAHSLFSRWFSESGKLVQKLFQGITEMVDDEDTFVVVLIDEVESLTSARASAVAGNEPSDAIRSVNALLTQLDKLKHYKNVLIMSTSNLSSAIDSAFIDRADVVQYVGLPPQDAIYWIISSCLSELMRTRIIKHVDIPDAKLAEDYSRTAAMKFDNPSKERERRTAVDLWLLAAKCKEMSGRSLRRLPVLAHARHIGMSALISDCGEPGLDVDLWLAAMKKIVDEEVTSRSTNLASDASKLPQKPTDVLGKAC